MAVAGGEPTREWRWHRARRALGVGRAPWPLALRAQVAPPTDAASQADEPISRAGNDDLWQAPCAPQDDEADCLAWEGETDG